MRRIKDADLRRRYQIVWLWCEGFSKTAIAQMLCCHRNTVTRVVQTFERKGEVGVVDGRVGNGRPNVTPAVVERVKTLIAGAPEVKWHHATWTQELLTLVLAEATGLQRSVPTICRILKQLRARTGRPRPVVQCPWPAWKRQRRLRELRTLIETCPPDELVLFADEVDIHLTPKIGPDWMLPGTQKRVVTPGKNQKRSIAGAMTTWGGEVIWVTGPSTCSALFIHLVTILCEHVATSRVIHLIVDNARIHTSKLTQQALAARQGKVQLHVLPPSCPKYNRIERLWEALHARVTRNHQCRTIEELMEHVEAFLKAPWKHAQDILAEAA
jgi:transposase